MNQENEQNVLVNNNAAIPEVSSQDTVPVQNAAQSQQVSNESTGIEFVPVGDNTAIPEVPSAPEQNIVENTNQESPVESTQTNQEAEVPSLVAKPNEYNVENVTVTEEEQKINAYIGANHQKIVHKRWNWSAFFLGGFYYFYRRMNIQGLILLILNTVILYYYPLALLILFILCGLFTNKLYVNYAKSRINKIEKQNMDAGLPAILLLCEKDGGTSSGMLFVAIVLQAFISFGFTKVINNPDFSKLFDSLKDLSSQVGDKLENENNDFNEDSILIPEGDKIYDGDVSMVGEPHLEQVFNISLPAEFVDESFTNVMYFPRYIDGTEQMACLLEIYEPSKVTSGEATIKQMRNYHAPDFPLKKITINNIDWIMYEDDTYGISYVHGVTLNNKPYIMTYQVFNTDYKDMCISNKDTVINGVSVK